VFVNLISNAIDAVPGQGTVTVGTCYQDGTARVFVQDTGAGIPPEIQERLFEPFFTTKDVGKGTGLGLYISHKIVTEHDGSIALESQVGRGTTVSVSLPATAIATPDEGKSASAA
jgi:two-component system NtrC family sensor kinase